ncbi:MAG: class II fructose-bisphosphate aldolase [Anaerolineales bacterium]|nr:class II fructose-bisphosphate aldolase [Anaerolineales bacterium]
MSLVNAKELLIKATREKYAVGAFNITSLVQMEAVIEAHVDRKAPVIIQTSVAPTRLLGIPVLVAIYRTLAESAPIPICLHLDHCSDVAYCKKCADAGYTNIMVDASKQPFEENIRQTKEVADYCHSIGIISVEGEMGTVGGVEDQVRVVESEAELCNPNQVLEFVERTGVDLLAPAIGTAHGIYKTKNPKIDIERFKKIFEILNGQSIRTPLVVHGGTGLPRDTVERLISSGGSKVNVSTELKHSMIDAIYQYITDHREEYDPGKIDQAVKEAIKKTVFNWIEWFGCSGKA